jgi:hypothetical protein
MTPDWNADNIEREIVPEDLRYLSTFDLSLNSEFNFILTSTSLSEFVASLKPAGHIAPDARTGTNMEELARRFKPAKSYTLGELKGYQKKLFSGLNKRVGRAITNVSVKYLLLTGRSLSI